MRSKAYLELCDVHLKGVHGDFGRRIRNAHLHVHVDIAERLGRARLHADCKLPIEANKLNVKIDEGADEPVQC